MSSGSSGAARDRWERVQRVKRDAVQLAPTTVQERLRLADRLIADSWRVALAAQASLPDAPQVPPWARSAERDARAHGELQRRLRELQASER